MDTHKKIRFDILIFAAPVIVLLFAFFFADSYVSDTDTAASENIINVEGNSMEPTFTNGQTVTFNIFKEPVVNDVIVFKCFSKCNSDKNEVVLIKRLTEINERGCFYVLGDNREHSTDSSRFGWLCPEDMKLGGVVIL